MNTQARLLAVVTMAATCVGAIARPCAAQDASETVSTLTSGLEIGSVIYVEDEAGRRIKGKVEEWSDAALTIRALGTRSQRHRFESSNVTRITKVDSTLTGLLIGAAVGAVPGVFLGRWAYEYCGNEGPRNCPGSAFLLASLLTGGGALIGWEIDRAIDGETPIFERPGQHAVSSTHFRPVVGPQGAGVALSFSF